MRLIYEKKGLAPPFFVIELDYNETGTFIELGLGSYLNGYRLTNSAICEAYGIDWQPFHPHDAFESGCDGSQRLIKVLKEKFGVDIHEREGREKLLQHIQSFLDAKIELARSQSVSDELTAVLVNCKENEKQKTFVTPEFQLRFPVFLSIEGKIYKLMPTNIDTLPQEFIKEYVEKEVKNYQQSLQVIINAIKQDTERKIEEIEKKYADALLMPEVTKEHVRNGLRVMLEGDCIVYLLPATIRYEKVIYQGKIWRINPEYQHVDEGFLALYVRGQNYVGVKLLDKMLNIIFTPHTMMDGFICLRIIPPQKITSVDQAISFLEKVKKILKTVNEDSIVRTTPWYRRIQENWERAVKKDEEAWVTPEPEEEEEEV